MAGKSTLAAALLAMSLVLAAPAAAADKATAVLKDAKGNEVGKAEFTALRHEQQKGKPTCFAVPSQGWLELKVA